MKKHINFILMIILIIGIGYFGGKSFFAGDLNEREDILSATIWKLSEQGYTKDDINNISVKYKPFKGGALPYEVYVSFKKNTSVVQIYSWDNTEKIGISNIGHSTP